MSPEESQKLTSFLKEVEEIFKKVVEWRELLFPQEVRVPLVEAWNDVQPRFSPVKGLLTNNPDWSNVGLEGKELNLKINGFEAALKLFNQKGTIKLLKKLLEWINIILGSLPGGEALKEFKEVIEKFIKDNED